ncbi:MAG: hypothetical protein KA144_00325 [Xanthomonadaceae bacterium]|nr:hypothetical protein [Xanthomonadaceae bacterium]
MTDGYLSKDREHIAGRQRQRRARMARIDYYPSPDALALIESLRTRYGPTNNNSGIINTIIAEWAVLAGLKQSEVDKSKAPTKASELSDQYARMRMTSEELALCPARMDITSARPEFLPTSHARAGANKTGSLPTGGKANQARVVCGAKRRRDGQPCQALSVPGKQRCKWHGGKSTGPRTPDGRARSLANLRGYTHGQKQATPCDTDRLHPKD